MERSAVSRQYVAVVRQQLVADDPRVSARSSARPRRRCILATSTHDSTSLEDDGIVERRWWQPTTVTPTFRTLHTLKGVASSAWRPPVQLCFTTTTVDCRHESLHVTAGSQKCSQLHVTRLRSARHVNQKILHDVCFCRQSRSN